MHVKEDPETKFESERKRLLDEYRLLTTKRLLNEYYVRLYRDILVSHADAMTSAGWDEPEITEGVFHGYWIGQPISGYADCKCSVCGAICNVYVSAGIPTQRYCCRCGAKMLEDEKNNSKNE